MELTKATLIYGTSGGIEALRAGTIERRAMESRLRKSIITAWCTMLSLINGMFYLYGATARPPGLAIALVLGSR